MGIEQEAGIAGSDPPPTASRHSRWKVLASVKRGLAPEKTFDWPEPRYAALFRNGLLPRENRTHGGFPPAVLYVTLRMLRG